MAGSSALGQSENLCRAENCAIPVNEYGADSYFSPLARRLISCPWVTSMGTLVGLDVLEAALGVSNGVQLRALVLRWVVRRAFLAKIAPLITHRSFCAVALMERRASGGLSRDHLVRPRQHG